MSGTESIYIWVYIAVAILAANLPWLSERVFFIFRSRKKKSAGWPLFEWLVLYFLVGLLGMGLEKRLTGEIYHQNWVFYGVTLALFVVFALPGFAYRYELKPLLGHKPKGKSGNSKDSAKPISS